MIPGCIVNCQLRQEGSKVGIEWAVVHWQVPEMPNLSPKPWLFTEEVTGLDLALCLQGEKIKVDTRSDSYLSRAN